MEEYTAMIIVRRKNKFHIDSAEDLYGECHHLLISSSTYCVLGRLLFYSCDVLGFISVNLFNCSVGRQDCSRCHTADPKYGCVWCNGASASGCVYQGSCNGEVQVTCPAPVIHFVSLNSFWTNIWALWEILTGLYIVYILYLLL